ncbi:carbon-nitrogen hydrolase family protein [Fodinicola feengrottensis]|uniref:hypothetical protein n=1 Tax=Fodinicola feengrottensis TaxID=435914 RepID=UPI0013D2B051|nr:hypothetical protein [Fodinicola feengrottensis]
MSRQTSETSSRPARTPRYSLFRAYDWASRSVTDIGHGDLFDAYARAGAQLVLLAAAPGLYGEQETRDWDSGFQWWRSECQRHLASSASRNGLWIGVCTQAGRTVDEDFPGGGYLFDPAGTLVAESADDVLLITADIR